MVSSKVWISINISLLLVITLLVLNLFNVSLPRLGKAQYLLDREDPLCVVHSGEEFTAWNNLDQCCLQARAQLSCIKKDLVFADQKLSWNCLTTAEIPSYWFNNKAYYYCKQQRIWK